MKHTRGQINERVHAARKQAIIRYVHPKRG
jgi:hypothetical protein